MDIQINNKKALVESLKGFSQQYKLRWLVDSRCIASILCELESSQNGEIEVGDPGNKKVLSCFDLDGVTIIDLD